MLGSDPGNLVPRGQYAIEDLQPEVLLYFAATPEELYQLRMWLRPLAELERAYRERGVGFVMLNPDAAETPARLRDAFDALKKLGFRGRYVHDPRGALAARLRAASTTEAFVLDGALTIVYRGAIDDQFGLGYALSAPRRRFLAETLDAVLAGGASVVQATTAPGGAGAPVAGEPKKAMLRCTGRSCDGLVIEALLGDARPVAAELFSTRFGVPPQGAPLIAARPHNAIPQYAPDSTITRSLVKL